jgi:N-acyl-D-amino-acid deacylase
MRTAALVLLALCLTACARDADSDTADGLPPHAPAPAYDWLISGGLVVDGTGTPPRPADVLFLNGRIAHVGQVRADTLRVANHFDAQGYVVTPGFIDAHAHGDPLETPAFPNFLAMGVTTIVLGQDGGSPEAGTLAAHLDEVGAARPAVNVAYLVGHNTIRQESGVGFGAPGASGLARMASLVEAGLDAGAFGLSTGLEYDPGARADLEELIAVARPVGARGGVVTSHLRNEDADRVEASLDELLEQGFGSGARVHATHLKVVLGDDPAVARRMLGAMADARERGLVVTGDVYPYTASFTGIAILFPEWARPPADYEEVVRTRGEELERHLRERVMGRNGPEATLFGTGEWSGRTLAEVADELDRPFEEVLVGLGPGGARAAYFVMDDEVMATFLEDPHVAVSSDGSPVMGHPRGYGSFARVIRRFVVEERRLTLEEAVRKMTGLTAAIYGLDLPGRVGTPRGLLGRGWAADVLVFDPAQVTDRADFENPHRLAEGMRAVWVNGVPAWMGTAPAPGGRQGQVLRATWNGQAAPGADGR